MLIRFLYFAFEKMTRLHVRQIPDYARILTREDSAASNRPAC